MTNHLETTVGMRPERRKAYSLGTDFSAYELATPTLQPSLAPTDVDLIRQFGGPASHGVLNPGYRTFRTPGIEGLIGYLLHHRCAVVLGDPICRPDHIGALASAFATFCEANNWSVIYAVASPNMGHFARNHGAGMIQFADLLIAAPQQNPEAGKKGGRLRWNLNRVRRRGVSVREYLGNDCPDPGTEEAAMRAFEGWRAGRRGLQMHLGTTRLFTNRTGCRWFIAERAGQTIGVLYMMRANCAGSRYLIDLVFSVPTAPSHTNELLVVTALQALREEGEASVCLGVGPRPALGDIQGFGTVFAKIAGGFYHLANRLVPQDGKTVFWEKFRVTHREPLYLLFQQPRVGIREFMALLKTFNFSLG